MFARRRQRLLKLAPGQREREHGAGPRAAPLRRGGRAHGRRVDADEPGEGVTDGPCIGAGDAGAVGDRHGLVSHADARCQHVGGAVIRVVVGEARGGAGRIGADTVLAVAGDGEGGGIRAVLKLCALRVEGPDIDCNRHEPQQRHEQDTDHHSARTALGTKPTIQPPHSMTPLPVRGSVVPK